MQRTVYRAGFAVSRSANTKAHGSLYRIHNRASYDHSIRSHVLRRKELKHMDTLFIIIVLLLSAIIQLTINGIMLFIFWQILKYYEKE